MLFDQKGKIMGEAKTWRELLGTLLDSPQERLRIARALNVNPLTVHRWVNAESNPRPQSLHRLIELFPKQREQLLRLVALEFPNFAEVAELKEAPLEIPAQFYGQVMKTYASSLPHSLSWNLQRTILEQAIAQLDPHENGLLALVMRCTPSKTKVVRSLRSSMGMGNLLWAGVWDQKPIFVGVESIAGHAASVMHSVIIQNLEKEQYILPKPNLEEARSATALPIRKAEGVAGAFYLCSTQADYFSTERLQLIEDYAELLTLIFEPEEFYASERLHLGCMPSEDVQASAFIHFHERVRRLIRHGSKDQPGVTSPQAEQMVWQQLEEEFLSIELDRTQDDETSA